MHQHRAMGVPRQIYASTLTRREARSRRGRPRELRRVVLAGTGALAGAVSVLAAVAENLSA
jgi:hypothetical protein